MRFYNEFAETVVGRNRLPHWAQEGATYFVTYRLADSISQEWIAKWKASREKWVSENPEPWDAETEAEYHRMFSGEMDRMMDEGHGSCILRDAECAEICRQMFMKYEGERYVLHAWVVMPNHVHVLFSACGNFKPYEVVGGWKRKSSRMIHELKGGSGALWQKDYFDRIIRDWDHFLKVARYIRGNPLKGRIPEGDFLLWESEDVVQMLG